MKLKYRNSDGEVIAFGHMPDLKAGDGETVIDVETELQGKISEYKFDNDQLRLKDDSEKKNEYWGNKFDVDLVLARFDEVLGMESKINLIPYLSAAKEYMVRKNFGKLNLLLLGLVQLGKASQKDYDDIKNIILEQKVDISA